MMTTATALSEAVGGNASMRVDEEAGVIRGVKVLGKRSDNGRVYSDEAMQQAAAMYEGCRVNVDHDLSGSPRRMADHWGVLRNVQMRDGSVYADLHYLKQHTETPALIERAKRFPESFGLSHTATGDTSRGKDGTVVVETITEVESVDVVTVPATNKGLFESRSSKMKTTTVRRVLKEAAGKDARRLRRLIEMDDFSQMADEPMPSDIMSEMGEEPTADDQVQASIESLVLSIVRDTGLDDSAKLAKIRKVMGVQMEMTGETPPAPDEEEVMEEDGTEPDDEEMTEECDDTTGEKTTEGRLRRLERRTTIAACLMEHGLRKGDLTVIQNRTLQRAPLKDVESLVESFAGTTSRVRESRRPAVRSRNGGSSRESYDDLRKGLVG